MYITWHTSFGALGVQMELLLLSQSSLLFLVPIWSVSVNDTNTHMISHYLFYCSQNELSLDP